MIEIVDTSNLSQQRFCLDFGTLSLGWGGKMELPYDLIPVSPDAIIYKQFLPLNCFHTGRVTDDQIEKLNVLQTSSVGIKNYSHLA